MKPRTDIAGAILAGGRSSRMGSDKAMLVLDGKSFIRHTADALLPVLANVFIVSDPLESRHVDALPVVSDIFKDTGPLGGIHAALVHAPCQRVFIVSCDMPLLSSALVQELASAADAGGVFPHDGHSFQPLCGVFERRWIPHVERHLRRGQRSVKVFLEQLLCSDPSAFRCVTPQQARIPTNINTPEDYALLGISQISCRGDSA